MEADGQRVAVAAVAPVGVEEPFDARGALLLGEAGDVLHPHREATAVAVPRVRAGANQRCEARIEDLASSSDAIPLGVIVPVQEADVARDFRKRLGMLQDDVGPGVHALAVFGAQGVDFLEELQVHAADAEALGLRLGASSSEFPRLVATGVEVAGLEERHELGIEVGEQCDAARVGRAECRPARPTAVARQFPEMLVLRQGEDFFHVPETGERPDQPHVMPPAMVRQRAEIIGREGTVSRADGRMARKAENVLDVKLEFVRFPSRELLDQGLEGFQPRHFAARTIVIDAAAGKVRRIADDARGDLPAVERHEVAQRLDGVVSACVGGGANLHAAGADRHLVGFRPGDRRIAADADVGGFAFAQDPRADAELPKVVGELAEGQGVGRCCARERRRLRHAKDAARSLEMPHRDEQVERTHRAIFLFVSLDRGHCSVRRPPRH